MKIRIKDTYDDHDIMILNGIMAFTSMAMILLIMLWEVLCH